jgi:hypothetical protein
MEAAHTVQRSDQKRVDEVKRIRSALASGESLLTNAERSIILSCAQTLEMNVEGKVQEALSVAKEEGGEDPVCILKVINSYIRQI